MKQVYGVWLPENDTHFDDKMLHSNGDYQRDIFQAAMAYVKEPKIFYDIGAHVGLWSLMAHRAGFKEIHAYEPNPATFKCLQQNLYGLACLYNYGIAENNHYVKINQECPNNSGAVSIEYSFDKEAAHVDNINDQRIHIKIDQYKLKPHETLVKIDTEGSEEGCVLGMDKIIYALRPVVCVEQRTNEDALKILQQMGMEIVQQVRKDYILTWKNQ